MARAVLFLIATILPRAFALACDLPGGITATKNGEQLSQPGPNQAWSDWKASLLTFRSSCLASLNYSDAIYSVKELSWTPTTYIQPQMHPYDLSFFDQEKQEFTVSAYLDDLTSRYGGIDSVLLWPTYTNIGIDDRNQFDLLRSMPGGVEKLREVVEEFHKFNVHVLYPYNPWDTGTRRSENDDAHEMALLLNETGGDGFNGDTMSWVSREFFDASGGKTAIEPEGSGSGNLASLNWDTLGWGYWEYPFSPLVDLQKWLEPRHLTNVCDRWNKNKTDNLQAAWFNGVGYETWENVWGTWNGITPRDGEAIRRVAKMLRFFGGLGYLQSPQWQPHAPVTAQDSVFATAFPYANSTLYSLVNRVDRDVEGTQVVLPASMAQGKRFFDAFHGKELMPSYVNYTRLGIGSNCYADNGATDLEPKKDEPLGKLSLAACVAACDSTVGCTAVVVSRNGDCYRRKDIKPTECKVDNGFDTYVKQGAELGEDESRMGFRLLGNGTNCYTDHGAIDVEKPEGSAFATNVDLEDCAAACGADCHGFVFAAAEGACYRRSNLVPAACDVSASGFATYMRDESTITLNFEIEALGFGALLETLGDSPDPELSQFLKEMSELSSHKLATFDNVWKYLPQTREENAPSSKRAPGSKAPNGMVAIPAAENFTFTSAGVEIEGDDAHGVDVQFPGEAHPQRSHSFTVAIPSFHMDKFPVTNQDYAAYLSDTGYTPEDLTNWLKNWDVSAEGNRTVPTDGSKKPVTYISLSEAQDFCRAAGKRLPSSEEFVYAAQGLDGRPYPWGKDDDTTGHFRPKLVQANTVPGPEDVDAHSPQGDSPFGVADMVGNVWHFTDVFRDEHTRAVVLRGSSNYRPTGSMWHVLYFPEARMLSQHEKFFLMGPRYERSGTIGFRCVMDTTK